MGDYGDSVAVDFYSADYWVFTVGVVGVEVEVAEGRMARGEVGSGGDTESSFDHSAHHALNVVGVADIGDLTGAMDASGFTEFDIDEFAGLSFSDEGGIFGAKA